MAKTNKTGPAAFRRRKRAAMHAEAELEDSKVPDLIDHPEIATGETELIVDAPALDSLVEALRASGSFAFDTEFIGEETFHPKICVIQVATTERVALVDPFEFEDLSPIWNVVADPEVETIVHDGGQDLDPVRRMTGTEPGGVVDTQVCAAFLDMPWPSSLAKIVDRFTGNILAKGHTFTEWDRRPLSAKQKRYAADDVRYLPLAWRRMREQLEEKQRLEWAMRECAESRRRGAGTFDVERQMKKLSRGSSLRPRTAAVLRELLLMRHGLAEELDLPHRVALPDEALTELMKSQPLDAEALEQCRNISRRVTGEHGERIIEAVKRGKEAEPIRMVHRRPSDETAHDRMRIDALWSALSMHALAQGIAPPLVMSRAELARWYLDRRDGRERPIFEEGSWRSDAIGDWFAGFLAGEDDLKVRWHDGGPAPG
ncbi:MAG: ribonuclease D [Phycisphaerales bacterium]|nr:ribonuclease D [Phycisphaerales bacterium]